MMARTKFFWTHRGGMSDEQEKIVRAADYLGLKHRITQSDDITDLCISVPDEMMIPFLETIRRGKHRIILDPVCENELQKTAFQTLSGLMACVDPTPVEDWEVHRVQRLFEFGSAEGGCDPVGVCIRVDGNTPDEGAARIVELLQDALEGDPPRLEEVSDGHVRIVVFENRATGEYVNVYLNVNNIDPERDDVPEDAEEV